MAPPYHGYTAEINAPVELVWSVILDKIKHPEKYTPGVKDVKILDEGVEDGTPWVLREMSVPGPPFPLKERLTYSTSEMLGKSTLLDNPKMTGSIYNKVHVKDGKVSLEFYSELEPKGDGPIPLPEFEKGVTHTKEIIEKLAAEGKTTV